MRFAPLTLAVLALAVGCRTAKDGKPFDEPPNPVVKKMSKPKLSVTKSAPEAPPSAPPGTPRPKPADPKGTAAAPGAAPAAKDAAPVADAPAPAAPAPAPVAETPAPAPAPDPAPAPAPAPETPAPAPAPVAETPAPAPAPEAAPAPAPETPAPAPAAEPAPAPAPAAETPAPAPKSEPAPAPAPAPAPVADIPANMAPSAVPSAPVKSAAAEAVERVVGTKPGNRVPAFEATVRRTNSGNPVESSLDSQKAGKLTVFVVSSTTCPYCRDYAKRLVALEETYMAKGVDVVHVYPNRTESTEAKVGWHAQQGFKGGLVVDVDAKVTRALAVDRTPTVCVVDATGVIVYRGAIDDSPAGDAIQEKWLADALDSALGGRAVAIPATDPSGCATEF